MLTDEHHALKVVPCFTEEEKHRSSEEILVISEYLGQKPAMKEMSYHCGTGKSALIMSDLPPAATHLSAYSGDPENCRDSLSSIAATDATNTAASRLVCSSASIYSRANRAVATSCLKNELTQRQADAMHDTTIQSKPTAFSKPIVENYSKASGCMPQKTEPIDSALKPPSCPVFSNDSKFDGRLVGSQAIGSTATGAIPPPSSHQLLPRPLLASYLHQVSCCTGRAAAVTADNSVCRQAQVSSLYNEALQEYDELLDIREYTEHLYTTAMAYRNYYEHFNQHFEMQYQAKHNSSGGSSSAAINSPSGAALAAAAAREFCKTVKAWDETTSSESSKVGLDEKDDEATSSLSDNATAGLTKRNDKSYHGTEKTPSLSLHGISEQTRSRMWLHTLFVCFAAQYLSRYATV